MQSFTFWSSWQTVYRRVFFWSAALLVVSLSFLWISYSLLPAPSITVANVQSLEPLTVTEHEFSIGTLKLTIPATDYLQFEHVMGGPFHPNELAGYIFISFLFIGIILLLSVITTLKRTWFFAMTGAFILLIGSFNLESLEIFGWTNKLFTILVLALYILPAYFISVFRPETSFQRRMIGFGAVTTLVAALIHFFSGIPHPFYYLSANGTMAATILTVIFIFMVSHEVLASFVFLVTRGSESTRSLKHFYIIAAVYLVNLGFIYANRKGMISWSPFPINLFVLITLAGILGVWGFRQREFQYKSIFRADPFGVLFYMALAWMSFAFMGYAVATANDPIVQFIEDVIIYGHLGYGIIFLAYVTANFFSLLGNNLQVYKVLYKPMMMPYFTYRLAGLIATFAFFAYSNYQRSVKQVFSGHYVATGDYFFSEAQMTFAEQSYRQSVEYDRKSYHGPYALTEIMGLKGRYDKSEEEYRDLVNGRGLVLGILNLSQLYLAKNDVAEATRVLKLGLNSYPKNGLLQNALGLTCAQLNKKDTALLLLSAARKSSASRSIAETNMVGLYAKFNAPISPDSLSQYVDAENPGTKCNLIALAAMQKKFQGWEIELRDTLLTNYSAGLLNNYLVDPTANIDTAFIAQILSIAKKPCNEGFELLVQPAVAHAYYRKGFTALAFRLMREAGFHGREAVNYTTLGLWSLEQGAFQNSLHYFDQATELSSVPSDPYKAIAFVEMEDSTGAQSAWAAVQKLASPEVQRQLEKVVRIHRASHQQALGFNDEDKFEYSRHHFSLTRENEFEKFVATITNPEVKARAILDRVVKLDEFDEIELAVQAFGLTKGLSITNKALYDEILHVSMRFLARQEQWPLLEKQLAADITFEGKYGLDKIYFEALLNEHNEKKEEASKSYALLVQANPFYEDAFLHASDYLMKNGQNQLTAFSNLGYAMDINPNSVKLMKSYVVLSAYQGYREDSQDAADKLKKMIPHQSFARFVSEHPEIFEITLIR